VLQTEVEFALPLGFIDAEGTLHRDGTMRRATAADEILPLRDARVQANPAYLVVILLRRKFTQSTPKVRRKYAAPGTAVSMPTSGVVLAPGC
jgi:hypothetical protein